MAVAQMFGSGKTTLGCNFIKQLHDEQTKGFIQEKLTGDDLEGRVDTSTMCRIKALQPERLQNNA